MASSKFTHAQLHEMFEYREGNLYWKIKPATNSTAKIGDKANKLNTDFLGERFSAVRVAGAAYRINKLIYTMFHGDTPMKINHIDGDKLNNKIENLESGIKIK
jgi:hypothetical protein